LTELEGSVLGTIGTGEPCTPYAVRREFQDSPSRYWSASAGAIYPLMRRLERRGLIRVRATTDDRRRGRLYGLTPAGRRALRRWLGTLADPVTTGVPPDPLRNRVAFFATLDPATRRTLLDGAAMELRADLGRVREYTSRQKADGRTYEYLVSAGAERMLEARLDWIVEVIRVTG
jgi:DNA-binding PadR family transcriptional regulator